MQKNNIRMVVQSQNETVQEFAERLESICNDLSKKYKDKMNMPPIVFLTSASDGRQTATLQFITSETDKTKEATFNGYYLHQAYGKFIKTKLLQTPQTDAFYEFLLKEVIDDYVGQ